jgi:hypothetical protein
MLGMTLNSNFDRFCAKTNDYAQTNQSLKVRRKSIDVPTEGLGIHTSSNYDDFGRILLEADA